MQLTVLGFNHNSAPIDVRECLAVPAQELGNLYCKLREKEALEAMIISTCNRVEFYIVTEGNPDIFNMLSGIYKQPILTTRKYLYIYENTSAIEHLVFVASGIDSMVMGEPQILGQVKEAFRSARKFGALGSYLNRLEQFVLSTSKMVRTNTGISANAVSVSYAAVDLAKKIFGTLENKRALIIGAGEMCELAVQHLAGAGIGELTITNRTAERAAALAKKYQPKTLEFAEFTEYLQDKDILISSTGSQTAILDKSSVEKAMKRRQKAPMFFIDIAVPRDIDPAVSEIENVYLYDIDDLKSVVETNRLLREGEAVKAKELIKGSVARFEKKIASLSADPVIKALKGKADSLRHTEINRFLRKNNGKTFNKESFDYLLLAMEHKLLHTPIRNLKVNMSDSRKYTLKEALLVLFDIKEQ
jgi:glutamyl-tRNA reductase